MAWPLQELPVHIGLNSSESIEVILCMPLN